MDNKAKLFVGGLPWSITNEELQELFAQFGEVIEAVVITDKFSGKSKGFGFVTMSSEEEAQAAIEALHESDLGGRNIAVNVARPPKQRF